MMRVISDNSNRVTNQEFLECLFGDEWVNAHVTAFAEDPTDIPNERRAMCWGGGPAKTKLKRFKSGENQYFTISLFDKTEEGRSARRRALFDACFVIVADDVKEKLPLERVELLPEPTYKLMTSHGSEQWGWVLSEACEDRDRVDNLLDGLVEKGLAPSGKDPGMKGVTRYVRLPGGSNTKAKRYINGEPFKCYLTSWEPENLHDIEALASVFNIDLDTPRGDASAIALRQNDPLVLTHPIMKYVTVTGEGADGWIRVDCVNASAHTDDDPSGAAIRVLPDGGVQYQCHHGACNGDKDNPKVTGNRALNILAEQLGEAGAGFLLSVRAYQNEIALARNQAIGDYVGGKNKPKEGSGGVAPDGADGLAEDQGLDRLRYIYLPPENKFYDIETGLTLPPGGLDGKYLKTHPGGKFGPKASRLLLETLDKDLSEADGIGWRPTGRFPPNRDEVIFYDEGRKLINTWRGFALTPDEGDASPWLSLVEYLIPDERQREVVLDYLAFIVQHPDRKPAFCIVHRGSHRVGKDFMYRAVVEALGAAAAKNIHIDNMLKGWGDYIKGLRFAIIEEVDKAQNRQIANEIKTFLAPTATGKRVLNLKGGQVMTQVDCMAAVMMSNHRACIAIEQGDRRYFVVDSWIERETDEFYKQLDDWHNHENGAAKVLNYLLNRDISQFNSRALPYITEGAKELVRLGRSDYEQDLEMLIEEGRPPFHCKAVSVKALKKLCQDEGIKGGNNGIEAAMGRLGWHKFQGALKKIDGKAVKCPTFFGYGLDPEASGKDVFEFYQMEVKSSEI